MKKLLLKFWLQDECGGVPKGKFHNLTVLAIPSLNYSNGGVPFFLLSTEARNVKSDEGDFVHHEPGFTLFVKSYEVIESLSDSDWKEYIKMDVFKRPNDYSLTFYAKEESENNCTTDGQLCMDIPVFIF